jgi:hypothetical protein
MSYLPTPYISFLPLNIPILPLKKLLERVFQSFSSSNLGKTSEKRSEICFQGKTNFVKRISKFFFKSKIRKPGGKKICKGCEKNFSYGVASD